MTRPSTRQWTDGRIAIVGAPRAGKSTLATRLGDEFGLTVVHSDTLMTLGWSKASDELAVLIEAGAGVFEGVAVIRALRKLLERSKARPVDLMIVLHTPRIELSRGQDAMRKACETILNEIEPELMHRGVSMEHIW